MMTALASVSFVDAASAQRSSANSRSTAGKASRSEANSVKPARDYVLGPGGRPLFKFKGPPKGATLRFSQIAASITKGQVLNSDEFFRLGRLPATFRAIVGHEVCTATLIGPKVLLTAAHCVDAKERKEGIWQALGGETSLADGRPGPLIHSCMMAPAYTADDPREDVVRNVHDFALCELDVAVNTTAETIAREPNRTAEREQLLLAGYGCTEKDLVGGQITTANATSGTLHVGTNRISGGGPGRWIEMLGKLGSKDAIACPGDSGGAAFAGTSIVEVNNDRGRRVVAVVSSGGPAGPRDEYLSYMAPLSSPEFKSFLDLWTGRRPDDRAICGGSSGFIGSKCRP